MAETKPSPSEEQPKPPETPHEPEETGAGRSDDAPPGGYGGNPEEQ